MKHRVLLRAALLALAAVLSGCAGSRDVSYTDEASDEVGYYDALTPYGSWVDVSPYGDCWVPLDVSVGWRPYTVGYWEYTDYGWMWMSQDPWGPVPYHYGRWAYDSYYGWVWVPDEFAVWSPAWVAWHYGSGWVGWAPLPPDVGWRGGVGLTVSARDLDSRIDRYSWCFVPIRDFGTTKIGASIVAPSRNVTLLAVTRNVTRYDMVNSRPAERGLRPDLIEREAGRRIPRYRVVESSTPAKGRSVEVRGRTIEIYRPPISRTHRRVRTTPPKRAIPSRAVIERQEADQRNFEARMREERTALEREHQRELSQPNRIQARVEEIRERHEAEMRAQQELENRERRALQERRKMIEEMQRDRGEAQDSEKARGKDREKNRGQERGRGRDKEND